MEFPKCMSLYRLGLHIYICMRKRRFLNTSIVCNKCRLRKVDKLDCEQTSSKIIFERVVI